MTFDHISIIIYFVSQIKDQIQVSKILKRFKHWERILNHAIGHKGKILGRSEFCTWVADIKYQIYSIRHQVPDIKNQTSSIRYPVSDIYYIRYQITSIVRWGCICLSPKGEGSAKCSYFTLFIQHCNIAKISNTSEAVQDTAVQSKAVRRTTVLSTIQSTAVQYS